MKKVNTMIANYTVTEFNKLLDGMLCNFSFGDTHGHYLQVNIETHEFEIISDRRSSGEWFIFETDNGVGVVEESDAQYFNFELNEYTNKEQLVQAVSNYLNSLDDENKIKYENLKDVIEKVDDLLKLFLNCDLESVIRLIGYDYKNLIAKFEVLGREYQIELAIDEQSEHVEILYTYDQFADSTDTDYADIENHPLSEDILSLIKTQISIDSGSIYIQHQA